MLTDPKKAEQLLRADLDTCRAELEQLSRQVAVWETQAQDLITRASQARDRIGQLKSIASEREAILTDDPPPKRSRGRAKK